MIVSLPDLPPNSRVYISGPMSGITDFNFPKFLVAERVLKRFGHNPVNPAKSFAGRTDLPWEVYIEHDLMLLETCTAILRMRNWWNSRGAMLEVDKSLSLNLFILDEVPYESIVAFH